MQISNEADLSNVSEKIRTRVEIILRHRLKLRDSCKFDAYPTINLGLVPCGLFHLIFVDML